MTWARSSAWSSVMSTHDAPTPSVEIRAAELSQPRWAASEGLDCHLMHDTGSSLSCAAFPELGRLALSRQE